MSDEQKRRGRPTVRNAEILEGIMKNDATRKAFKEQVDNLVSSKKSMLYEQECFSEDVAAVAEKTGLSKGFIGKIVTAVAKNKESEVVAESEGLIEVIEQIYSENGDE